MCTNYIMINSKENPIEWANLLYELDDLKEHLDQLINEMHKNGSIESEEYRVQVGHLYAHLNRAWNSRNATENDLEKQFEQFTKFPQDIQTCG